MLKLEVIGNLGADAEVKTINEREYVTFSVAHTERGKGEDNDKTIWVSALWGGNGGKLLQYLKKGTKVFLRGDLNVNLFQSKSGAYDYSINVMVREIQLCGSSNRPEE